jgi:hypothetical protein
MIKMTAQDEFGHPITSINMIFNLSRKTQPDHQEGSTSAPDITQFNLASVHLTASATSTFQLTG